MVLLKLISQVNIFLLPIKIKVHPSKLALFFMSISCIAAPSKPGSKSNITQQRAITPQPTLPATQLSPIKTSLEKQESSTFYGRFVRATGGCAVGVLAARGTIKAGDARIFSSGIAGLLIPISTNAFSELIVEKSRRQTDRLKQALDITLPYTACFTATMLLGKLEQP